MITIIIIIYNNNAGRITSGGRGVFVENNILLDNGST